MSTGEKIKQARKKKGITQKQLGDKLGVSQAAIGQFENNKSNPKLETVRRIASAMGVPIGELVDDWGKFSKEEIENDFKAELPHDELDMLQDYRSLNENGKDEARKRINELTEIPKYRKSE
jgi:transcriptional regulator with XRE-family HTH domain